MQKQEYTIKINITEVRDLRLKENDSDAPNPYVVVQVAGYRQDTQAYQQKISVNFGETKIFDRILLSEKEFEEGEIILKVMSSNKFYRFPDFIGQYACNLTTIYKRPNHELRNKWVALIRPSKPRVVFGYLKFDAFVVGEGDALPAYDLDKGEDEDDLDNQINYDDLGSLTLATPSIERKAYSLTVNIYKGEGISNLSSFGNVNPQIILSFNGMELMSDEGGNSNPEWKHSFEFPFWVPTLNDKITLRLMDKMALGSTILGYNFLSVKKILQESMGATWVNFYGNEASGILNKIKERWKGKTLEDNMFMGRALVSANCKTQMNAELRRKNAPDINAPEDASYIIWFDVYELTGFTSETLSLDLQVASLKFAIPHVRLKKKERYMWGSNGRLPSIKVNLPRDEIYIPDFFINVYQANLLGKVERKAYLRLDPKVLISEGVSVKVGWKSLKLLEFEQPVEGQKVYLLYSLNFGLERELDRPRPIRLSKKKGKFEVWAQIYQAKNLPVMSKGYTDPYVGANVNGKFKQTSIKQKNLSPIYNEFLRFRARYPQKLELANDIIVEVYDSNKWSDDLIGSFHMNPADIKLAIEDTEYPPDPKWYKLYKEDKFMGSFVLASFLIFKIKNRKQLIPKPIYRNPKSRKCIVKILIIGTRKLKNVLFSKVRNPQVRLTLGQSPTIFSVTGKQSSSKSDSNHNYLELKTINYQIPEQGILAPSLDVVVVDQRNILMGNPTVGTTTIFLHKYLPWISKEEKQELAKFSFFEGEDGPRKGKEVIADDFEKIEGEQPQTPKVTIEQEGKPISLEMIDVKDLMYCQNENILPDPTTSNYKFEDEISLDHEEGANENAQLLDNAEEDEDFAQVADWNVRDEDAQGIVRPEIQGGYEAELKSEDLPYETISLYRNEGGTLQEAGFLKIVIKVVEEEKNNGDEELIFESIVDDFSDDSILARVYLINANHLAPRNFISNTSDPYIWLKTNENDSEFKFSNRVFNKNLDPEIMMAYPINIRFPDDAFLNISVWDKGDLGRSDELIGETEIDLENRWFHPKYKQILETNIKNITIEKRSLVCPGYKGPQGALRLWIELLDFGMAQRIPPEELQPPSSEKFEIRVVIWRTDNIPLIDGDKVDIMVKCSIHDDEEGEISKNTDVHYNSKDGAGEFNWRMKFRIRLPSSAPRISVAIADKNILSDATICEANIDLSHLFREVHRKKTDKKLPRSEVKLTNPSQPGKDMGSVSMELWILPVQDADMNPVGEERNEPNKDPFLEMPENGRSLADFMPDIANAIGGIFSMGAYFKRIIYTCLGGFLVFIVVYVVFLK